MRIVINLFILALILMGGACLSGQLWVILVRLAQIQFSLWDFLRLGAGVFILIALFGALFNKSTPPS